MTGPETFQSLSFGDKLHPRDFTVSPEDLFDLIDTIRIETVFDIGGHLHLPDPAVRHLVHIGINDQKGPEDHQSEGNRHDRNNTDKFVVPDTSGAFLHKIDQIGKHDFFLLNGSDPTRHSGIGDRKIGERGIGNTTAVLQPDDPLLHPFNHFQVMGCHKNRRPPQVNLVENLHDFFRHPGIEIARRLVGNEDDGIVHQGPRNGYPLLLSAGQAQGITVYFVLQTDPPQDIPSPPFHLFLRCSDHPKGKGNIIKNRFGSDQFEVLENDPDIASKIRNAAAPQAGEIESIDLDLTPVGLLFTVDEFQQCCFPGAARPRNKNKFPLLHMEGNPFQGTVVFLIVFVYFTHSDRQWLTVLGGLPYKSSSAR